MKTGYPCENKNTGNLIFIFGNGFTLRLQKGFGPMMMFEELKTGKKRLTDKSQRPILTLFSVS